MADEIDRDLDENYMGTKLGGEPRHELVIPLEGDVVKGKVAKIDEDTVYVDLGAKAESLVKKEEFSAEVAVGDEYEFVVVKGEDDDGNAVLSKRRADERRIWDILEDAFKTRNILREKVSQVVKGGLIINLLGIRGFMPASQIDFERIDNLYPFVGEEVPFIVVEFDRENSKVILSRKEALVMDREQRRGEALDNIKEGAVMEGKVVRLTKYGAFVNLGGIDGLVHISEMSWTRVQRPEEVVNEGDSVKVMVLSINKEEGRISLSIKRTTTDPWEKAVELFQEGQILKGVVERVVSFGAFIKIHPEFEGLVHISEVADEPVKSLDGMLKEGQEVQVKVLKVDAKEHKIALSIKRVKEEHNKKEVERFINEHRSVGGIRLGDLLEGKLGKINDKK